MKKETVILLFLIFSMSLLIPLSEQKQIVSILPNQKMSIVYNLHNPTLQITADKNTNILVNISEVGESGKELNKILNQGILENKLEVNNLDPGLYAITFLSTDIVRIEVQGKGLYLSSIVIIVLLLLINLILVYIKYND